jgi:hypothetical protein
MESALARGLAPACYTTTWDTTGTEQGTDGGKKSDHVHDDMAVVQTTPHLLGVSEF